MITAEPSNSTKSWLIRKEKERNERKKEIKKERKENKRKRK